jgi:hypothetical protein
LRFEGGFESAEEVIEGSAEFGEFVVRAVEAEPPMQVRGGDLPRGGGDGTKWSEEPAGEPPRDEQRDDHGDDRAERRADHELMGWPGLLGGGACAGRSLLGRVHAERDAPMIAAEQNTGGEEHRSQQADEESRVEQRELHAQDRPPRVEQRQDFLAQLHHLSPIR